MEPTNRPLREYIESGDYFNDARSWYKHKYIYPFSERSIIALLTMIIFVLFLVVTVNLYKLLPISQKVKYSVTIHNASNKISNIMPANVYDDPKKSVSDILLRYYVKQRETYNYDNLKKQFIYIKNNSTRIVAHKFFQSINIDNPTSPILTYQKSKFVTPKIISVSHISPTKAVVKFESTVRDKNEVNIKNYVSDATIEYEIDEITHDMNDGAKFNFTVTDYKLNLIEEKKNQV